QAEHLVQRACSSGAACAACSQEDDETTLQPKLIVGPPNDQYEREADGVAEQIVDSGARAPLAISRVSAEGKAPPMRQNSEMGGESISLSLHSAQGEGRPLAPADRVFFELAFGAPLGHVRVHDDARSASVASAIGARAFTTGSHLFFNRNEVAHGSSRKR